MIFVAPIIQAVAGQSGNGLYVLVADGAGVVGSPGFGGGKPECSYCSGQKCNYCRRSDYHMATNRNVRWLVCFHFGNPLLFAGTRLATKAQHYSSPSRAQYIE